jgi:hypothetical protein
LVLRDRKRSNQFGVWGKTQEKWGHESNTRKIGISDVNTMKWNIKNKHIRNILTFCIEIPQR